MEGGLEWIDTRRMSNASQTEEQADNGIDGSEHKDDGTETDHNHRSATSTSQKSLFCMAWMAVYGKRTGSVLEQICNSRQVQVYTGDRLPVFGLAKAASFALPPAIAKLVVDDEQAMELGDADNVVFQRTHAQSKHGQGTVGKLTDGIITRADYYQHAIVLALTLWMRPDVYPTGF